jgi:hypothetical protein
VRASIAVCNAQRLASGLHLQYSRSVIGIPNKLIDEKIAISADVLVNPVVNERGFLDLLQAGG